MNLGEMIRSEKYQIWESETIANFGFSDPRLYDRICEAVEDGMDGRTHAETIDMWRDYLRNVLAKDISEEECSAIENEIDETWDWHLHNDSLELQCG